MASAAPNTAVPLPTATATSATIGIAAPPVSTMHAAPSQLVLLLQLSSRFPVSLLTIEMSL